MIFTEILRSDRVQALDPVDVVVSKLKPFRSTDLDDIQAMVQRDYLLVEETLIELPAWLDSQ